MTDLLHAIAYLLPGLAMLLIAALLRAGGRRAAAAKAAPRWARVYYWATTALLALTGAALLALGVALAAVVLRP
jgi:hypothetical protein